MTTAETETVTVVKYFANSLGQNYGAAIEYDGHRLHAIQTHHGLTIETATGGAEGDAAYDFLRSLEVAGLAEYVFNGGPGLDGDLFWRGAPIVGLDNLTARAA